MSKVYRFGEFALDGATRELSRGAQRQILPPKMFECLQWLIEHRDRAVGRDELLAAVWGQVDADANVLVQVIARLRRLIDAEGMDGADSAIRTVPRFGYRWAAATQVGTGDGDTSAPVSPRAPFASAWRIALWSLALAGLVLIVTVPLRRSADAPAPLRALVLPASVDAGEAATDPAHAEHGWLRLGLMALAIERLRAAGLPVVPADNIVATTRGLDTAIAPERYAERVATDWPGSRIVTLDARRQDGRWHVEAVLARDARAPLRASADGADVLDAARDAADGLALALGGTLASGASSSGGLLQAQAASLAGEADRAFALLDRVEAPLRQNPEYRYQRAWSEFLAGRLDAAGTDLRALLADVSAADAPVLRARVLNALANVQYQQGDVAGQRASADAAVALLQGQDAPAELGRALMGRAVALVRENRIDAARRDFQLARVALESGGDRLGMARAELALGVVQKKQGRYGEARAVFQGALLNLGVLRDLHDELLACTHLTETYLQLLEPADALALEPRLAELIARAAPSATRSLAQLTRIEALAANGRLGEARELLARVCGDAGARCEDHPWRLQLAALRLRLMPGDASAARDLALALRTPRGAPADASGRDPGRAWLTLLRERIAAGDTSDAARVLADAQAWADGDTAIETPVYAALARAESAAARGDDAAARGAYERALADADANAVPADLLVVASSYVGWLLAGGDGAEAAVAAGRVAAWARTDFDAALVQLRVQRALGHRPAWQAALAQAQSLAGERLVPPELAQVPVPAVAAR